MPALKSKNLKDAASIFVILFLVFSVYLTTWAVRQARIFTQASHPSGACLDFNADGQVTQADIDAFVPHMLAERGSPNYDPRFDLDGDGNIDIGDVIQVKPHLGSWCPVQIRSFTASPTVINQGSSTRLSWSTYAATSVVIKNVGTFGPSGQVWVKPSTTTTYMLTALNPSSQTSTSLKITLVQPPPPVETLIALELEISLPYLSGLTKVKISLGDISKEIQIDTRNKSYFLDFAGSNLALNQTYTLSLKGEKTLMKKILFTPKSKNETLSVGNLLLGDLNEDNQIDSSDKQLLIDSIVSQTPGGDLNGDGLANSIDWAILLKHFGKKGD